MLSIQQLILKGISDVRSNQRVNQENVVESQYHAGVFFSCSLASIRLPGAPGTKCEEFLNSFWGVWHNLLECDSLHHYRVIQNLDPSSRAETGTTLEKPIVEPYSTTD